MAVLARQLYFEAVKVGDELPPLVKPPVDRTQIARYAGASDDFNPLYVDEHLARNAGFPSAFAPGILVMGFMGELVVDWLRGARLRRYTARFVKIVWPGDVITCRGRVADRRFEPNGVYAVDLDVWAENQRGELVVKGLVTAQLYYSAEDDARQRAGHAPLIVTQEEESARLARLSRAQPPKKPEPSRIPSPPPRAVPPAPGKVPPPPRATPVARVPAPVARVETPSARPAGPVAPAAPARRPPAASPRAAEGPRGAAVAEAAPTGKRAKAARTPPSSRRQPAAAAKRIPPKPRPGTRPVTRTKPASRASRPRAGTKPTGKKRR